MGTRFCKYFNSQPHKEADVQQEAVRTTHWNISTHSLTRRLTVFILLILKIVKHFNSQPHKEADPANMSLTEPCDISTHSLTRRLTLYCNVWLSAKNISTHSLTRRLTTKKSRDI